MGCSTILLGEKNCNVCHALRTKNLKSYLIVNFQKLKQIYIDAIRKPRDIWHFKEYLGVPIMGKVFLLRLGRRVFSKKKGKKLVRVWAFRLEG